MLKVKSINYPFGGRVPKTGSYRGLNNISFNIDEGEALSVIGPSASGKTTLGLICAGFIAPFEGEVLIKGTDLHKNKLPVNLVQMVFQDPFSSINPRKTILEWLILSQYKHPDKSYKTKLIRIEEKLNLVNLKGDCLNKHSNELSGGECQRVAIAACLLANAKLMILDEPTSMLDSIATNHVLNAINNVREKTKVAIMLITHDLYSAMKVSDAVLVLIDGNMHTYSQFSELKHRVN